MKRRAPRRPHRLGRAAALLAATAGLVFGALFSAVPASAHSNLLFTAPAADSTVATAPETLTLLFDEPVTTAGTPINLTGPQGSQALGSARLTHENRALEIPVPGPASPGIYTVQWKVTAGDGDVMSGSYRYALGPSAAALGGGQTTETQGSWPTTILRALLFTALALALGEQVGARLLARLRDSPPGPRPVTLWACLTGLAAAAGLAVLLLGNGSLTAGLTRPAPDALTGSRPGILALVEVGGSALILVAPNSILITDYGRVLLAKTVLVSVAAGLALAARRLLGRKSGLDKIRRPARVEAAALGMVLVVSSVLTVLPVPARADAPLAFPPPATGPVVPAAALAGK